MIKCYNELFRPTVLLLQAIAINTPLGMIKGHTKLLTPTVAFPTSKTVQCSTFFLRLRTGIVINQS